MENLDQAYDGLPMNIEQEYGKKDSGLMSLPLFTAAETSEIDKLCDELQKNKQMGGQAFHQQSQHKINNANKTRMETKWRSRIGRRSNRDVTKAISNS